MSQIFELFSPLGALFTLLLSHVYTGIVLVKPQFGDKVNACFLNIGQVMIGENVYSAKGQYNFRMFYRGFFYVFLGLTITIICLGKVGLEHHKLLMSILIVIICLSFLHEGSKPSIREAMKNLGETIPYLIFVFLLVFLINKEFRLLTDQLVVILSLVIYVLAKRRAVSSIVKVSFGTVVNIFVQLLLRICLALGKEKPFDALMWLVGCLSISCVIMEFM